MEDKELNLDFSLMPLYNPDYDAAVLVDTPLFISKGCKKEQYHGGLVNLLHEDFHLGTTLGFFYQPLLTTIFLNYLFLKTVEGLSQSPQQEAREQLRKFYQEAYKVIALSKRFYRTPKEKQKRFEKAERISVKLDLINEMVSWYFTLPKVDIFLGAIMGENIEISSQLLAQVLNKPFFCSAIALAVHFAKTVNDACCLATDRFSILCHTVTELLQAGKWRSYLNQQQFAEWWKQDPGSRLCNPQKIRRKLYKGEAIIFPPPPALMTMFFAPERCVGVVQEKEAKGKAVKSLKQRGQWLKEIYLFFREDLKNWPTKIRLAVALFPLWELRFFHEARLAVLESNSPVITQEQSRLIKTNVGRPMGFPCLSLTSQDPGLIFPGKSISPEELKTLSTKKSEKDWLVIPSSTDLLEDWPGDLPIPYKELWVDFFLLSHLARGTGNEKYVVQCPFVACFKDENEGAFPKWCAKSHFDRESLDYCRIPRDEPSPEDLSQLEDRQGCPFWSLFFDIFGSGKM